MRTVLHFHPALAPVKIGVLPLSKKLNEGAEKVYAQLAKKYNCEFDDRGNIGKRYRRQDEIGTPFCVTYDFESETDGAVTVRDRDTMEQERIKIEDLDAYLQRNLNGKSSIIWNRISNCEMCIKIGEKKQKSCCLLVNVWYYKYVRFGKTCILVTRTGVNALCLNKSYSILY